MSLLLLFDGCGVISAQDALRYCVSVSVSVSDRVLPSLARAR